MATLYPVPQGPQGSSNDVEMDDFEIDLNMIGTPMMQDNLDVEDDKQEIDADLPDAQSYPLPQSPHSVAMENDDSASMTNLAHDEEILDFQDITQDEIYYEQQLQPEAHNSTADAPPEEPLHNVHEPNLSTDTMLNPQSSPILNSEQHPAESKEAAPYPEQSEGDTHATTESHIPEPLSDPEPTTNKISNTLEPVPDDGHTDQLSPKQSPEAVRLPSEEHSPVPNHETEETTEDLIEPTDSHPTLSRQDEQNNADNLHPILVTWENQKDWLFQPQAKEEYQGFYLQDKQLAFQSFSALFQNLRTALDDAVMEEEEIQLEIPAFDVLIPEDSSHQQEASIADFVDAFVQLEYFDGNMSPAPFELYLSKRVRFHHRLAQLKDAVLNELGISQCEFLKNAVDEDSSDFTGDDHGDDGQSSNSPLDNATALEESTTKTPIEIPEALGISHESYHADGVDLENETIATENITKEHETKSMAAGNDEITNGTSHGAEEETAYGAAEEQDKVKPQSRRISEVDNLQDPAAEQEKDLIASSSEPIDPLENFNFVETDEQDHQEFDEGAVPATDFQSETNVDNGNFPEESLYVGSHDYEQQFDLDRYDNEEYQTNQDIDDALSTNPQSHDHIEASVFEDHALSMQPQESESEPTGPKIAEEHDEPYPLAEDDLIDYDDEEEDDNELGTENHVPEKALSTSSSTTVQGETIGSEQPRTSETQSLHTESERLTPNKRTREPSEDVQSSDPDPKRRKSGEQDG